MTIEYSLKTGRADKQKSNCLVLPITSEGCTPESTHLVDQALNGLISHSIKQASLTGDAGTTYWLNGLTSGPAERILLVGIGSENGLTLTSYKKATGAACGELIKSSISSAGIYLTAVETEKASISQRIRETVLAFGHAGYEFTAYKSKPEKRKKPLKAVSLFLPSRRGIGAAETTLHEALGITAGVSYAKDLANTPPNICHPAYLARQARALQKRSKKLNVEVLEEADMKKLGMGAFLAVSHGSEQPGKLITMSYTGAAKTKKPVVLVGKGITFDTGGISIKPSAGMDEMKFDMGGAASVFGVMSSLVEVEPEINVVGIVAAAENMPDGKASRPGDIVTTMSGQTVEILNTDAEGRLVLCDALTYAKKYKPETIIDIATLTGACIVALGHIPSGLLANNDDLAKELIAAGDESLDLLWQLPLWDEYGDSLKSNFADMANIGNRSAGTITAAIFLSRFTKDYHWAHLDIAGTAWNSGANKGATGRPVPLLMAFLLNRAHAKD